MKPSVVIVHFNKNNSKKNRPWTVHVRGSCIPAKTVTFNVPVETVFKPLKKQNPRAWIKAKGKVSIGRSGDVKIY